MQEIPQAAVGRDGRQHAEAERFAHHGQRGVHGADGEQQQRIMSGRRSPETEHRQQRQERPGPLQRFGEHRLPAAGEELAQAHAQEGDEDDDERPVFREEAVEEPGHRHANMQDEQGQQHFRGIDVEHAAAFGKSQRIASGQDGRRDGRHSQAHQSRGHDNNRQRVDGAVIQPVNNLHRQREAHRHRAHHNQDRHQPPGRAGPFGPSRQ